MEQQEREELIFLQSAHVTQYTDDDGKSQWHVRKNITSEDLYDLPGEWKEKQVFEALNFARKFELIAWNEGIKFGKKWNKDYYLSREEQYKKIIKDLMQANEKLSDKLAKFIGEEEEY